MINNACIIGVETTIQAKVSVDATANAAMIRIQGVTMLTSMALMESVLMQQDISTGEVVGQSLVVPCCTLRSFAASIFVKSQPHTIHRF